MRLERHIEALNEVMDEITSALEDPKGLKKHQRRLAIMLSLGACGLIEIYFHKLGIMKNGSTIKHSWFKQKRIKESLSNQIISGLDNVKNIGRIIKISEGIEEKRDDMAYGAPVKEDDLLKEKINDFLELKNIVENEIGDILESK